MSRIEHDLYTRLYVELLHSPAARPPRLLIYLHGPLDVLLGRIRTRGRPSERDTEPEYWALLHERYERWIGHFRQCPVLGTEPSLVGRRWEMAALDAIVDRAIGGRSGADTLSDREQEVLRGIAWGRSNKEIAAELGLSVKTVESYKATATHKLNLRTRTQIIRYALAQGWLREDSASE